MRIGIPAEVKNHEYRVAITPAGVRELVLNGHEIFVQAGAGHGLVDHRRRIPGLRRAGPAYRGRCVGHR